MGRTSQRFGGRCFGCVQQSDAVSIEGKQELRGGRRGRQSSAGADTRCSGEGMPLRIIMVRFRTWAFLLYFKSFTQIRAV